MKKILFFLFVLFCGISVAYLYVFYPEEKWIPKTVLGLPKLDMPAENIQNYNDYPYPTAQLAPEKEDNFNVIFDTEPLAYFETPWKEQKNAAITYGKKVNIQKGKSIISIILTDVGINENDFEKAIQKLPPKIVLSFSPYALNLEEKVKMARQKGFENMFDLPIDTPSNFFEGGAYALNENMPPQEISHLLEKHYFELNLPFVGFVAPMISGESFASVLSSDIKEKGLVFIDLENTKRLDSHLFYSEALDSFLEKVIQTTPADNKSIVVLPLTPLTMETIVRWVETKDLKNVEFVPISVISD